MIAATEEEMSSFESSSFFSKTISVNLWVFIGSFVGLFLTMSTISCLMVFLVNKCKNVEIGKVSAMEREEWSRKTRNI